MKKKDKQQLIITSVLVVAIALALFLFTPSKWGWDTLGKQTLYQGNPYDIIMPGESRTYTFNVPIGGRLDPAAAEVLVNNICNVDSSCNAQYIQGYSVISVELNGVNYGNDFNSADALKFRGWVYDHTPLWKCGTNTIKITNTGTSNFASDPNEMRRINEDLSRFGVSITSSSIGIPIAVEQVVLGQGWEDPVAESYCSAGTTTSTTFNPTTTTFNPTSTTQTTTQSTTSTTLCSSCGGSEDNTLTKIIIGGFFIAFAVGILLVKKH